MMKNIFKVILLLFVFNFPYLPAYSIEPEMVSIPPGEFIMGGSFGFDDEKPAHTVYLDGYWIGKYEVTNEEYREFVKAASYDEPEGFDDPDYNAPRQPVAGVSWFDAEAFTKWKSRTTGLKYRLPTEAEWEKAARGTDKRRFPWGNKMPGEGGIYRANFRAKDIYSTRGDDGFWDTAPAGSYENGKSPFGVYDMAGNIWEWCSDWFDKDYYKHSPKKNPKGSKYGMFKILRGGSWLNAGRELRVTNRISEFPDDIVINYGFRLARD